ncbi:hypothetical protein ACXWYY_002920 [Enterobacter hormaechei]
MHNSTSIQTNSIHINNVSPNEKGNDKPLKLTKLTINEITSLRNSCCKFHTEKNGLLDVNDIFANDPNTKAISMWTPDSYKTALYFGKECHDNLKEEGFLDTRAFFIHDKPFPENMDKKTIVADGGGFTTYFNRNNNENETIDKCAKDFLTNSVKMPQTFMPEINHGSSRPTTPNISNEIKSSGENDKVKTPSIYSKIFNSKNAIYFASGLSSLALFEMTRNLIELLSVKNNDDEFFDKVGDEAAQNAIENKIQEDFSKYMDIINNPESTAQDISEIKAEMDEKYIMSAVGDNIFSQAYITEQYRNGELASISQDAKEQAISSAKDFVKDIKTKDVAFNAGEAGMGLLFIATALKCKSNKKKIENKKSEELNLSLINEKPNNNILSFSDLNSPSSKNNHREQFINTSSVSWK